MRERAGGVELESELGQVEALAPAVEERVGIRRAGEGREGVVFALEGRGRAAEPERGEIRGSDAVARRETGVEWARVLGRVVGPREEPARLLHGEAEGHRLTLRAQAEKVTGSGRGSEAAADRARVEPAVI